MKRSLARVWMTGLLALLSFAFAATGGGAQAQAPAEGAEMTTEEILRRMADALGGGERLAQVETVYTRGKVSIAGLNGTVEEWQTARGQHRQVLDLGAVYKNTNIFDGRGGWVVDLNNHVRELDGGALEDEVLAAYLGSFSHLLPGRMQGTVTANGVDPTGRFYVLQIKPQGGRAANYFVDKTTFLPARIETLKAEGLSVTHMSDWREQGGIKMPFEYRQVETDPRNNAVLKIDEARVNTPFDAKLFERPETAAPDFRFTKGRHSLSVPFDLIGNIIYLPLRVNNSAPMWFILDSGASANMVEARRARALGLKSEGKLAANTATGFGEAGLAKGVSFSLPGLRISDQTVVTLPFKDVETNFRRNFGGGVGYDFISRFVVEIDYANRLITLHDPRHYTYKGKGKRLPLVLDGVPFVRARVSTGGEPVEGLFEIDTGYDGAVSLYRPFVDRHNLLGPGVKTVETKRRGAVGEMTNLVGRLARFELGDFTFENVVANFTTEEATEKGARQTAGLIGGEIFRRFTLILDYSRKEMILEPNANFSDSLDGNLSGLELDTRRARGGAVRITNVQEDSSAEEAGIRAGDTLLAVDGKPVASFKEGELDRLFEQEGREYLLTLRRGTKVFKSKVQTRRRV